MDGWVGGWVGVGGSTSGPVQHHMVWHDTPAHNYSRGDDFGHGSCSRVILSLWNVAKSCPGEIQGHWQCSVRTRHV